MNRARIETLLLTQSRGAASRLRVWFYRFLGMTIGQRNRLEKIRCRNVSRIVIGNGNAFSEGCWLWPLSSSRDEADRPGPKISIGDGNYFNRDVMLDACGQIAIGNCNMFGPRVYVADSNHSFDARHRPSELPMKAGSVRIGDRCWIGAHAAILSNVELGDNCVVAAGAVVTKSFPAGSVVAGVPARLVRALS
jgi:maltose O-acetyltransferase